MDSVLIIIVVQWAISESPQACCLCFKVRQTAKSLTSTPMQMILIFTRKVLHLASL